MDKELMILEQFFLKPTKEFQIRQIAKLAKINPMTTRKYLYQFAKRGILEHKNSTVYKSFVANTYSQEFKNLKLFYNLEKIRESDIVNKINEHFDFPSIILFGSYSKAEDGEKSDCDICVISSIKTQFNQESFEEIIKRPINILIFSEIEYKNLIKDNPELALNILRGIQLFGISPKWILNSQ